MLTLFAAKNTVALASHIALEETGLPHQVKWISFADAEQTKPDYLAINPKGRVPALVADDQIITETPAILEYIAETSGLLRPGTLGARARVREMLSYCASTFHVNHAHKLRGIRWADKEDSFADMTTKVPQTIGASCAHVESQLSDGWVAGEYSIADIHLFTICTWLAGDGVDIRDYPKLSAHWDAMHTRPAVQRTLQMHS